MKNGWACSQASDVVIKVFTCIKTAWNNLAFASSCSKATITRCRVSGKYTRDNAGDLKKLSMGQTLSEDNRSD